MTGVVQVFTLLLASTTRRVSAEGFALEQSSVTDEPKFTPSSEIAQVAPQASTSTSAKRERSCGNTSTVPLAVMYASSAASQSAMGRLLSCTSTKIGPQVLVLPDSSVAVAVTWMTDPTSAQSTVAGLYEMVTSPHTSEPEASCWLLLMAANSRVPEVGTLTVTGTCRLEAVHTMLGASLSSTLSV